MTTRLIHQGFKVIPLLGVLDEETDAVTPAMGQQVDIAHDGLTHYSEDVWPHTWKVMRAGHLAEQKAQAEAERLEEENRPAPEVSP